MMGKTRYFLVATDGTIEALPRNHVSNFSNPFKDRMYLGSQNTNPGLFPKTSPQDKDIDLSTASFYSVKVTGGEQAIYVKGTNNPTKGGGETDKIIY